MGLSDPLTVSVCSKGIRGISDPLRVLLLVCVGNGWGVGGGQILSESYC